MKNLNNYISEKLVIDDNVKTHKPDPKDPFTWAVGDILVCTWGATMSLVEFYRITKFSGKTFELKELKKKFVSGSAMQGKCIAIDEIDPRGETVKARIGKNNSVKKSNTTSAQFLRLWDGEPEWEDHMD